MFWPVRVLPSPELMFPPVKSVHARNKHRQCLAVREVNMSTLVLETDGGVSEFVMKPLERALGWRRRKRVAVDAQGRECRRALMSHDGLLLA